MAHAGSMSASELKAQIVEELGFAGIIVGPSDLVLVSGIRPGSWRAVFSKHGISIDQEMMDVLETVCDRLAQNCSLDGPPD